MLITGVHPTTRLEELSKRVPGHDRMFHCCVDIDREATNTIGNAVETRRWARERGFNSLIVVTSSYHIPRAMAEVSHQLPDATLIPYPVVTDRQRARAVVEPHGHSADFRDRIYQVHCRDCPHAVRAVPDQDRARRRTGGRPSLTRRPAGL